MKLFSRRNGEGKDALVILPGLLGSSANWQSIAKRMGQHRTIYTLDMRNHGQSPWSDNMDYEVMADDVVEFIESLQHTSICLLGHSMGGKAAMRLAFNTPQTVDSLIIADIAPVTYEHDFDDLIEPMIALDLSTLNNRADADIILQSSISSPHIRAFLLHNLAFNKISDSYSWRPNLNVLLRNMSNLTDFKMVNTESFTKPTLFIHGANSNYVTSSARHIISQHFTQTSFTKLENAGHWLHAEQPGAFVKACEAFLSHDY